ncbi:MAG: phosphotransferase [Burkholderiales bacterium]|nr:phosphotransferase [Burkholderiales bacterium]
MLRYDFPANSSHAGTDPRLDDAIAWVEARAAPDGSPWMQIAPASADASFRRYFRVTAADGATAIIMDAPPPKEDVRPFINVTRLLADGGVHVPALQASDEVRGFLLLGDLGNATYLKVLHGANEGERQRLFHDAIDTLTRLQQIDPTRAITPLARYDAALLRREIDLFPEWFLGRHLSLALSDDEKNALERVYATLIASALAQPTVLTHRDYMPRNLMVTPERNPGVLDYQDAVIGPISYDVASLMRDAFISWEEPQVIDWVARYWDRARKSGLPVRADFSEFYREFEWMGLQRHLKVLGIFARINYRDGKPHYLADTPRFLRYARDVASRYQAFSPLVALIDRIEGTTAAVGYTF